MERNRWCTFDRNGGVLWTGISRLVDKINQEEHFHAYRNRIPNLNIIDIYHQVDFIQAVSNGIVNNLPLQQGKIEVIINAFIDSVSECRDLLYQETMIRIKDDKVTSSITIELGNFLTVYGQSNTLESYAQIQDQFLWPLRLAILRYQKELGAEYLLPLYGASARASSILDNLKFANNGFKDHLLQDIGRLETAFETLEESMKSLEEFIKKIDLEIKPSLI